MTQVDEIEHLQNELTENPKSLNFVRLAELYLQREMALEAKNLVQQSLKFHPHSISGLLLFSRILKQESQLENGLSYLDKATQLAPDNWHAWLLKAEANSELQKGKAALYCFKKVLLLNPNHSFARRTVAKLEVLTADDYEEDLFSLQSLHQTDLKKSAAPESVSAWTKIPGSLERSLALVDALTVRLDTIKAIQLLNDCTQKYGSHPEIESRRLRLSSYDSPTFINPNSLKKSSFAKLELIQNKKVSVLQELLRRIEHMQRDRLST